MTMRQSNSHQRTYSIEGEELLNSHEGSSGNMNDMVHAT